jgi:hypothetical protein
VTIKNFIKNAKVASKLLHFWTFFWTFLGFPFAEFQSQKYCAIIINCYDIMVYILVITQSFAFWKRNWKPFSKLTIIYFLWFDLHDEK